MIKYLFDNVKLRQKLNTAITERDSLQEIIKSDLYKAFIKSIEENLSYERLRAENTRLRKQNKELKKENFSPVRKEIKYGKSKSKSSK